MEQLNCIGCGKLGCDGKAGCEYYDSLTKKSGQTTRVFVETFEEMNLTPHPAWEEELNQWRYTDSLKIHERTQDPHQPYILVGETTLKDFIRSLLKKERTATEHEKSMTDITFAFEAGEKSGRIATLREVIEEVEKVKDRGYNHGYSVRNHLEKFLQHKLTSEL